MRKYIFYLLGDLNIDISLTKVASSWSTSIDTLNRFGSVPIITISTWVTGTTSAIIDHIVTNHTLHAVKPGVIRCDKKTF